MSPNDEQPQLGQALLFSSEIERAIEKDEAAGRYTGIGLRDRRPGAYQACIGLLGRGMGMLEISALLGIHHRTVAAVRDLEPEKIDAARSKQVSRLRTAADLQLEQIIENPGLVPWNVKGLLIAQLLDKAELLDGRATSRSGAEAPVHKDIHGDWDAWLAGTLPSEKQLGPDQVIEIGAQAARPMGLDGEKPRGNSGLAIDRGDRGGDVQSVASTAAAQATTTTATHSATDAADDLALDDHDPAQPAADGCPAPATPPGGVSLAMGVPSNPMLPTVQKFYGNEPPAPKPV